MEDIAPNCKVYSSSSIAKILCQQSFTGGIFMSDKGEKIVQYIDCGSQEKSFHLEDEGN
jgi:hypothetical protein